MTNFSHPLMKNNILQKDLKKVSKFLKEKNILTQSKNVKKFESEWSKWLGVKYSVFVNSGSSANYLTILALKIIYGTEKKNEIITPTLTWISDVVAVINNGFKPIFADIDFKNLSMHEDEVLKKINSKTRAVFITHAQGFNGLSKKILDKIKKK